jgi:hypothetical protein
MAARLNRGAHAPTPTPSQTQRRRLLGAAALGLAGGWLPPVAAQTAFDHGYGSWNTLLARHVVLLRGGQAGELRYAGMAVERGALQAVLAQLSAVTATQYAGFSRAQRMAFLINAYNAFTVELVLTRYPRLQSIRELGTLLRSPWKQPFVPLLGGMTTLDGIEHDMLRRRGDFDDPRIHFAVNCASIGCPMLREEAYTDQRLERQLDEQEARFLSDRSRNRYNPQTGRLEVSKIFDWYGEDFRLGHRGIVSLPAYLARHADRLADAPADRERLRAGQVPVAYLDYDWKLNDASA